MTTPSGLESGSQAAENAEPQTGPAPKKSRLLISLAIAAVATLAAALYFWSKRDVEPQLSEAMQTEP